jgi:hypothetical protein
LTGCGRWIVRRTILGRRVRQGGRREDPRARCRTASTGFFAALDVRIIAGRDFTDEDGRNSDNLVIVSQSLAQRMFPSVEAALNRGLMWTDSNFASR